MLEPFSFFSKNFYLKPIPSSFTVTWNSNFLLLKKFEKNPNFSRFSIVTQIPRKIFSFTEQLITLVINNQKLISFTCTIIIFLPENNHHNNTPPSSHHTKILNQIFSKRSDASLPLLFKSIKSPS